jgi:hypothetical protein
VVRPNAVLAVQTPSERLDLTDADAVADFVREHVVRGYVDSAPVGTLRSTQVG